MRALILSDTVLVPLSLFIVVSYHGYLWHNFKHKPSSFTTIGRNTQRRRLWFQHMETGDDKKGMLAVQSLRNTLMGSILTATVSIIINISLAALANNSFNASHFLNTSSLFGSHSSKLIVLKFGSACLLLTISFLCSSMAVCTLIDANMLINAAGEFASSPGYVQMIFERGFALAVVGNRVLCMAFPMLFWLFGPVTVLVSSAVLVWGLYELDFSGTINYKIK
uniref:DUF599 domain-containing protein n=1 Tax=Kalanchoe fedtschenkoi TaxID=63787 RepID=A0A7N0V7H7_KALFE